MGKTPIINEYGGDNYPRRRKVKRKKDNLMSFRCRDCETLRYVTHREANRAARPRCLACGGTLIETDPSHKRTVQRLDTVALVKGKATDDPQPRAKDKPGIQCQGCGVRFVGAPAGQSAEDSLILHLNIRENCQLEYKANDPVIVELKRRKNPQAAPVEPAAPAPLPHWSIRARSQ